MFGMGKIKCVSCGQRRPKSEIRYTHRNGEDLPLCKECWQAAKIVQGMISVGSRAEDARERYKLNPK